MSDDGSGDDWVFFALGAAMAALWSTNRDRYVQADAVVLQNARAIRAVYDATGQMSLEQMQTLYLAEQIEGRVEGWRVHNDARRYRGMTTAIAWIAGIAFLAVLAALPDPNPFVLWFGSIGAGLFCYGELEKRRASYNARPRPTMSGTHQHGGWGSHSHPHTRRHRHYVDIDGPMY